MLIRFSGWLIFACLVSSTDVRLLPQRQHRRVGKRAVRTNVRSGSLYRLFCAVASRLAPLHIAAHFIAHYLLSPHTHHPYRPVPFVP